MSGFPSDFGDFVFGESPFGVPTPIPQPGSQQPGALSPLPFTESIPYFPVIQEPGQTPGIGTPIGPYILADDVTFITGVVEAPMNSFSTIPDPVPLPNPPSS